MHNVRVVVIRVRESRISVMEEHSIGSLLKYRHIHTVGKIVNN